MTSAFLPSDFAPPQNIALSASDDDVSVDSARLSDRVRNPDEVELSRQSVKHRDVRSSCWDWISNPTNFDAISDGVTASLQERYEIENVGRIGLSPGLKGSPATSIWRKHARSSSISGNEKTRRKKTIGVRVPQEFLSCSYKISKTRNIRYNMLRK